MADSSDAILRFEQPLTDDQVARLKAAWDELFRGATQHIDVEILDAELTESDLTLIENLDMFDPAYCHNCGGWGKTVDDDTYICPNCGNEWDIYGVNPDD